MTKTERAIAESSNSIALNNLGLTNESSDYSLIY